MFEKKKGIEKLQKPFLDVFLIIIIMEISKKLLAFEELNCIAIQFSSFQKYKTVYLTLLVVL